MKKKTLSFVLVLALALALLPAAALASAGPARPKLGAPTDLTWGKRNYEYDGSDTEDIPGYAQWRCDLHQSRFEITYYNAATDEPVFFSDEDTIPGMEIGIDEAAPAEVVYSVPFLWDEAENMENGTYYFTVQALGDGVTYNDSEIARSDTWQYVKPEYHLNAPAALAWSADGTFTLPTFGDRYFDSYEVAFLFSATNKNATDVSELEGCNSLIDSGSGNTTAGIEDWVFEDHGPGYYYLRVRALSKDITQALPSDWSPLSGAYYYDGTGSTPPISSDDDFVIDENGVLTKYNGPGGEVVIPDGVTAIGEGAFEFCAELTSVKIPNGVVSIEDGVFYKCTGLTGVTIPDSVTSIGGWVFTGCSSLKNVTISTNVTSIGTSAFASCSNLDSIYIPEGVDQLAYGLFKDCANLTKVTIPDSVTSIADYAFNNCASLTNVIIPENVVRIGEYAFGGCSNLADVTLPRNVIRIEEGSFAACASLTEVAIPLGVTQIGVGAFGRCTNLTRITIPVGVTYIANYVFNECPNLTVYGYTGSEAQTYCEGKHIPFVSLGIAPATAQAGTLTSDSGESVSWSITEEGQVTVDVEAASLAPEEKILVGCYDDDGRFTGLGWIDAQDPAAKVDPKTQNVKLFWLDGAQKPQSPSATVWGK